MIAYIEGSITRKTPAYVIIECGGIGYHINISLHTYSQIQNLSRCKLFTYFHVKEDAHTLYGFAEEAEKNLFAHLISVSGVGPSTGRMILSSYAPQEIQQAIVSENVKLIESVKGIGPKSARRIILELKDKLAKGGDWANISFAQGNTKEQEALSALVALGFSKGVAERAVREILRSHNNDISVEELIKKSLKSL